MPDIRNSILFVEDDSETNDLTFDRDLQSLIHQPGFETVKGIVIGRFEKASKMTREKMIQIIKTKKELDKILGYENIDLPEKIATEQQLLFRL